jgi:hypothetical protein
MLITTGCYQEIKSSDISKINGYWEIEKVILPDGEKKDYKVNETIDYFEFRDNKGFRTKVTPQFNGKYLQNGHIERIEMTFENGKTFLNYATEFAQWKEELVEISDKNLVLKNENKLEYHYKKPTPFTIK